MKKVYLSLLLFISCFCTYAQTYLALEDFSAANGTTPPAGWSNVSNNQFPGNVWQFVTTTPTTFFRPLTGAGVAFPYATIGQLFGSSASINTNLITPSFSTIGSSYATLEFTGYYTFSIYDTVAIEYSLNGTNWATVKNINDDIGEDYQRGLCSYVVIPLPAGAQNQPSIKLRFSFKQPGSGGTWYIAIDNIKVINRPPAVISANTAGGNWGDTATWAGGRVPAYFDDVVIPDNAFVRNDISPVIKNLTVGNGISGYVVFNGSYPFQELTITGNLLTNPGSTFNPNYNNAEGRRVVVKGNLTLNGTSDFSVEGTLLRLLGTTPQTISGTGNLGGTIAPIRNIELTNPAGITINRVITVTDRADVDCNVNNGNNLVFDNTMGLGTDSVGLYLKGNGNFSAPVLVGATAKYCVNYYTDYDSIPVAKTAGNEIPASNTLYRLYMYNTAGLIINKNLIITGPYALDLFLGSITINPSNSITCTNSAFNGAQGEYRTGFVQGGDLILSCAGTSTKTFPVGLDGHSAFITFSNLQANGQVSVRLLKSGLGAPGAGLSALSATRRWYSRLVTGTFTGYSNVTIKVNEDDNFGGSPRDNFRVAFQTSLVSNYNSVGQSNFAPNNYITSANAQTLFGYHALGLSSGNLPIIWTGSAGTNNWGDAFNWRNNLLPTNADEVIIDDNATVNLASGPGNYFAKSLTVRKGSTLNSTLPNTLTVGPAIGKNGFFTMYGNFNMNNGTINVNGKMQCGGTNSKLNFQMSGGNIIIDGNAGGNTATSVSASDMMLFFGVENSQDGSTINGTGGTITIVDPNATPASATPVIGIFVPDNNAGSFTLAGTTIKFGDGISTDACQEQGFTVETNYSGRNVPLGNVILNSRTDGYGYRYLGTLANNRNVTDITGNLTVMPNAEVKTCLLTSTSGYPSTIRVGGNLINNGTIRIFGLNGGRLVMGSSPLEGTPEITTPQTISGSGYWSNSEYIINHNLSNLVVNNRGGLTLNMPLKVVHNLELKKGTVTTTDVNLLTHGDFYYNIPGALIVDSGYINGPMKRLIPSNEFSDSTGLFPIGIGNVYRPAKISFTTAPVSAGSLTARFVATAGGMNGLPLNDAGTQINVVSQQGYWEITDGDGLTGGTYNVELTGTGFGGITTPAELRVIKRTNSVAPWTLQGMHNAGAGITAKRTGLTAFSQFTIAANSFNNSLPVGLINFRGYKQGNVNNLSWTTNTEINNAGFELQRSADGINFNKIDYINSAAINGNSNTQLNYQYSDSKGFAGNNYYRLKQIDKDANAVFSNTILLKGTAANGFEITGIYPNPVVYSLHLAITTTANEKSIIEILDAGGKLMQKQSTALVTGSNTVTVNVSSLAKGTYLIKLISENGNSTKYFVKE